MVRTLCCFLAVCALLRAQPAVTELLEEKTRSEIRALAGRLDGVLGVAAVDLTTGRGIEINPDTVFPQASSIKIAVMLEVFRAARAGAFRLDDAVTLAAKDAVGGSGRLGERLRTGPVKLSVRELIAAMMEWSDNTATNRLIAMAGRERVNRTLDELGLSKTRLLRVMMDQDAAERDQENVSTPREMVRLVELIWRGKAAHAEDCREMIEVLQRVQGQMRAGVPDGVAVAAKPGGIPGVHCETGIVYLDRRPFALSVMTAYLDRGRNPVAEVTGIVYRHFEKVANANRYGRRLR